MNNINCNHEDGEWLWEKKGYENPPVPAAIVRCSICGKMLFTIIENRIKFCKYIPIGNAKKWLKSMKKQLPDLIDITGV